MVTLLIDSCCSIPRDAHNNSDWNKTCSERHLEMWFRKAINTLRFFQNSADFRVMVDSALDTTESRTKINTYFADCLFSLDIHNTFEFDEN